MQPSTKKILTAILLIGALLIAGRFFVGSNVAVKPENLKPSQLDFTKTNTLVAVSPVASAEPTVGATVVREDQSQLTEAEVSTVKTLEAVMRSKNDNDPRINTELRAMTPSVHETIYKKYATLPAEDRNTRGLMVFLVARDLKSAADLDFLKKVYDESPCLSLEDCKNVGSDDAHFSGTNQTTMNYPQFAGLYQLEKQLEGRRDLLKDPVFKDGVLAVLKQADNFPVPAVQKKSWDVRKKFGL